MRSNGIGRPKFGKAQIRSAVCSPKFFSVARPVGLLHSRTADLLGRKSDALTEQDEALKAGRRQASPTALAKSIGLDPESSLTDLPD